MSVKSAKDMKGAIFSKLNKFNKKYGIMILTIIPVV